MTMEQTISGISDKLNEKISKKQFIKECGIFIFVILISPTLLNIFLNKNPFTYQDNKLYYNNELILESRDD